MIIDETPKSFIASFKIFVCDNINFRSYFDNFSESYGH